ncbi:DUF6716 putative glycosyltransferase [Isoptericola sp. b408]|uniref:DUF6716 putative glycosyltransferase n=1 Tax=Isoptericola sp. b408 TaxID=3064653 RepID=UPI00271270DD|nr:DUF6716 putative glycosyltransferase [Isoptericola sp. b408]MDO8152717.1 hypothetical protein [Isoptericola sp. b408]
MSVPRVLAVADSDSYLKWAAWTLAGLRLADPANARGPEVVVVRSPLAPSAAQRHAATVGTAIPDPDVLGPWGVGRLVADTRPDVVLVAATGPVAELVARQVVRATRRSGRPALVTGLPGMALPATPHGTGWRRWADAFVVHGPQEVAPYAEAFAAHGVGPRLVLSRLPFMPRAGTDRPDPPVAPRRVVFAAQAKVPATRAERLRLLDGLATLTDDGYRVVVKLRGRGGERQTHNEPFPLDVLWDAEHGRLGRSRGDLDFAVGALSDHLGPGTALVTVSSTAALESLARGLPTVLVQDFGVGPDQLNEAFAGSGCLRRLEEIADTLRGGGPVPDPAWCEDGYLHTRDDLPGTVAVLGDLSRRGALPPATTAPWSWPRHVWAAARSALPTAVSARLRRRP